MTEIMKRFNIRTVYQSSNWLGKFYLLSVLSSENHAPDPINGYFRTQFCLEELDDMVGLAT
jgi:hypothetical protein